jgi:hypothetical protein
MNLVVHHSDGLYALYLDGRLDTGPTEGYVVNERIHELAGVTMVLDSAFQYAGPGGGVAQNLVEVTDYIEQRSRRQAEVEELERQAAELLERARHLRS